VVDAGDVRGVGVSHFRRLSIRVHDDSVAEPLRARLLELVPAGFEELETGDGLELAAYVPVEDVEALLEALPGAAVEPVPEGWEDAWRSFHHPVTAGGLWIGPPWEEPRDPARAVVIDPGRAFGTGAHPTSRLCVELLAATAERGSLLDVGCGSGVLAIAGARLGFAPVVAVDVDAVAVETTRANAAANRVAVDASLVDAEAESLPAADVAVANVLLRPVETILARLEVREALTSGYLVGERPAHDGWSRVETVELDGWAADRFRRLR
jgi:ribosomal protein L11 methyltransferase